MGFVMPLKPEDSAIICENLNTCRLILVSSNLFNTVTKVNINSTLYLAVYCTIKYVYFLTMYGWMNSLNNWFFNVLIKLPITGPMIRDISAKRECS